MISGLSAAAARRLAFETRLRAQTPPHIIKIKKPLVRRAKSPALQHKTNTMQTVSRQWVQPFRGGMVAAPTHGPNAVTTKKRVRWVYGCGPHACGPYRPRSAPCSPYPGSRGAYLTCRSPFSSGRRPRNTTIFHFYFLIFNFLNFYFSRASSAAPMTPAR